MQRDGVSPIILLGSERSGTNLLRAILDSHSDIASPPPAGFVDALAHLESRYFPQENSSRLDQLIEDVITMTKIHHNPWDVELDPVKIKLALTGRSSFWEVFRVVNELYAVSKGRAVWVSKEPGLFKFIEALSQHLTNAKFIYLVRDGRDVAASMLRGHLHEFHIYFAAHTWVAAQRMCLAALANPMIGSKVHVVKYEELIQNPEIEVSKMMQFIGLPFQQQQLKFHENKSVVNHSTKSRFWKNLSQPIDNKNMGHYEAQFSRRDISVFETIARVEMDKLGYQTKTEEDIEIGPREIKYFKLMAKLKRYFWSLDPRAEAQRSRRRVEVTREIINRNFN